MANLPALAPTTFGEMMQFAELLAQSTMIPPAYQKNPANIVLAIMYGREVGLGVLQSLQNVAVIGGRPTMFGDAMLAVVKASPFFEDIVEHIEGEGENRVAVCKVHRKGKAPVTAKFSILNAKQAKLWGKAGPWTEYPGRMMQMRARGFALRDAFPDVLRGVVSAEEAADMPRQAKDITPEQTVAAELDSFAAAPPNQGEIDLGLVEDPADAQERDLAPKAPEDAEPGDAASAASAEPLVTIEAIKPRRIARGGWDWPGYADAILEAARELPRDHFGAFRTLNAPMLNSLRLSNKDEWARVQQTLADYERDGSG